MNGFRVGSLIVTFIAAAAAQDSAKTWNDRGLAAAAKGDQAEAQRSYNQAVEIWQAMGPEYEAHLATTRLNLAQSYCAQGKRREGAKTFEAALAGFRRAFGVRNEWTLTSMNLLASAYLMLGEAQRAQPLFEEALQIEREIMPKNLQLARTLQGLATININAGKLDTALAQAEEALGIVIAAEGEGSMDVAMAYATTAEVHRIARRYARALPLYRKSQAIYEKTLGPEHPRVAAVLSQQALILMADGKYALAEKDMLRSLEIVKKSCPGCEYELWVGECNLGLLRFKQKRYAEADALLSHSLEMQEKYLPNPGPDMVGTIQALAATREKLRQFDEAARLNKRASMLMSFQ